MIVRLVNQASRASFALLLLSCAPNVVVGTRDRDAAVVERDGSSSLPDFPDSSTPDPDAGDQSMMQGEGELPMDDEQSNASSREDAGVPGAGADASGCSDRSQCTDPDEPLCDVARGRCVECLSDADCKPDELCEIDGECDDRPVPCTSAAQCAGSDDPVCHPSQQICVECVSDSDCRGPATCQPDFECD